MPSCSTCYRSSSLLLAETSPTNPPVCWKMGSPHSLMVSSNSSSSQSSPLQCWSLQASLIAPPGHWARSEEIRTTNHKSRNSTNRLVHTKYETLLNTHLLLTAVAILDISARVPDISVGYTARWSRSRATSRATRRPTVGKGRIMMRSGEKHS